MGIQDFTTKVIGDKRRWREYKARSKQLPPHYRSAIEALERYVFYFGPSEGDGAASVFEDLIDLFERAAADDTPIREIVGEDPVEFVEAIIQNYTRGGYVARERDRLTAAIERAEQEGGAGS